MNTVSLISFLIPIFNHQRQVLCGPSRDQAQQGPQGPVLAQQLTARARAALPAPPSRPPEEGGRGGRAAHNRPSGTVLPEHRDASAGVPRLPTESLQDLRGRA